MGETRKFPYPIDALGVSSFGQSIVPMLLAGAGKIFYVDPLNGADTNSGRAASAAFATLYKAHASMTSGANDVCILIGDGGTTGTARLSLALAQGVDATVSAGTLVWSKSACHLVGVTAPAYNQRARIAPPSGTYTASTFGAATLVTNSGSGNVFANFSMFHGFSTGGAAQICWTDSGSRNYYEDVWFGGMGDQTSADDTGSRSIKLTGAESVFNRCTVGLDTVTRGAANYSVEFSGTSCKRHQFRNCLFPFHADASSPAAITVAAAAGSDRWQIFENCLFLNAIGSGSTTLSAISVLAASIGGIIVFKDCMRVGITDWASNATGLAQVYAGGWESAGTAGDNVGRSSVATAS